MSRNRLWSLKILELTNIKKKEVLKVVRKKANEPKWKVWDARRNGKQRYKHVGKSEQMLNV